MLLFRSEEMVDRWCRNWNLPRGATLSPATCWTLAREWYHDRRDPNGVAELSMKPTPYLLTLALPAISGN